jgi:hypothetical protein
MSAERVLSERELNRALLARQCLLERHDGPLPRTVERIGGVQAQYAPSIYVGLWSRVAGLQRADLTQAIERRKVIQATLMRVTIHLVARGDYWAFAIATRAARRTLWLRSRRGMIEERAMQDAADRVSELLLTRDRLYRKEIEALVGKPRAEGVGLWVDLVRVPPSGTWERRRADLFALAESWIGPTGPTDITEDGAVGLLVRRYLAGFGPRHATTSSRTRASAGPPSRRPWTACACAASAAPPARSCSTSRAPRCPIRTRPRRCASCRPGTRRCSCTRAAPASCPRSTARRIFHVHNPH